MIKVGDRIQLINTGGFAMLNKEHKGTVVRVIPYKSGITIHAVMDRYPYGTEGNHLDDISPEDTNHNFFHYEYEIITGKELTSV